MNIEANGILINCEISGSGPPLVLIHGISDNLNMWYHQIPTFSENYRVIVYDLRGCGKTIPGSNFTYSQLVEDIYQLLLKLKIEEAFFLGYSLGGRIALDLTINHPRLIKSLVLANTSAGLMPPSPKLIEYRRKILNYLDKGEIKRATDVTLRGILSADFIKFNPVQYKRYKQVKLLNNPHSLAQLMHSLSKWNNYPNLAKINCPVLIITGNKDFYVSNEETSEMHKKIPGSELVILSTGHASCIELPELFNKAVLEFLAKRSNCFKRADSVSSL